MALLEKPGFRVSPVPATEEGARTIWDIEMAAQNDSNRKNNSAIGTLLWPPHLQPKVEGSTTESDGEDDEIRRMVPMLGESKNTYLLITEEATNKPVAYTWWAHNKGQTKAQWDEGYANRYRPPTMNGALMDATGGVRYLKRAELLGEKDFFQLKELYVLPESQRQGLGGLLVAWGVQKADELGLPAYTEASPEGLGLYLRHGFREVDRVTVDLEEWGGPKGDFSSYGLLYREPQQVK
ncbi:hypothetical protein BO78DRAFT_139068 [Aspergillus sclerotiicarbonarius CBS 121057]|uniref:N-acetyltransferase domain-containing protein n=1 Tax=Aspergillus sclerotiicarbonarius (strain CBS 121057 / IBT 28362) TaxID=1448318 RepID=A0A319E943_ASPSB|nr:hypothetical protein BO78DRAFT_139068 [Aspergillus sclerotiicarbonarius CBS 121057]